MTYMYIAFYRHFHNKIVSVGQGYTVKWGLSKKPKVNLSVLSIIFHDFQNVESR